MAREAKEANEAGAEGAGSFSLTRVFDAPRALVWAALTRSEHLAHWWGPKGTTVRVYSLDLREGGLFHYGMALPDGKEWFGKWIYRAIEAPHRLVFVQSFSDAEAGITRHPLSPDWPREVLSTFELTEEDGKTTLVMRGVPVTPTDVERRTFEGARESMNQGFSGTWGMLDEYLALVRGGVSDRVTARELFASRVIDAPRERVFDAWTDPARIARWWGPKGFSNAIETFDMRPGGTWKFVMRGPDGKEYPNQCVFVEVVRPSRIVVRHKDAPLFQLTATLDEAGPGKTRVSWRQLFESAEECARVAKYAEPANHENLEKLAAEVLGQGAVG